MLPTENSFVRRHGGDVCVLTESAGHVAFVYRAEAELCVADFAGGLVAVGEPLHQAVFVHVTDAAFAPARVVEHSRLYARAANSALRSSHRLFLPFFTARYTTATFPNTSISVSHLESLCLFHQRAKSKDIRLPFALVVQR